MQFMSKKTSVFSNTASFSTSVAELQQRKLDPSKTKVPSATVALITLSSAEVVSLHKQGKLGFAEIPVSHID